MSLLSNTLIEQKSANIEGRSDIQPSRSVVRSRKKRTVKKQPVSQITADASPEPATISLPQSTKIADVSEEVQKLFKLPQDFSTHATNEVQHPLKHYSYDKNATLYAQELLGDQLDVGEGVKVIKLTTGLQMSEERAPNLVTRQTCRDVWHAVYEHISAQKLSHAVLTGTSGIGKSRSLMYLLRLLLQEKKVVVFDVRKEATVYAFIPTADGYQVYKRPRHLQPLTNLTEPLLADSNTYFLIVPNSPTTEPYVRAHTVLVCPPDYAHYRAFAKQDCTEVFYMPPWTRQEITKLVSHMGGELDLKTDLNALFDIYGGNPRAIFHHSRVKLHNIHVAIECLSFEFLSRVLMGMVDVARLESDDRSPGSLFSYTADVPFTADVTMPKVASEYIKFKICTTYWSSIMNKFKSSSFSQNPLALGRFFEGTVASALLRFGGTFRRKNLHTKIVDTLTLPEANLVEVQGGWKDYISHIAEMPEHSAQEKRTLVKPSAVYQPAIDFADAKDRAFQVTVCLDHGISISKIAELIDQAELNEENKLQLYFVVPECKFGQFTLQSYTGRLQTLNTNISKCVVQYALAIPNNMPNDFRFEGCETELLG